MAVDVITQNTFIGGISQAQKVGTAGAFRFGAGLDIYTDPNKATLLPAPVKVSGSTVADLIKWIKQGTPHNTSKYFYGDVGKIYRETSSGTWSLLQTTTNSKGQGLEVHDNYLYYTQNSQIGRYGPLDGTPAFADAWQTGLTDTSSVGFAPIKAFLAGFAVGHGNKLAWWDGSVWDVDKLVLPPGLNIVALEVIDDLLYIGTRRGSTVLESEEGYTFAWDGTSSTFEYFIAHPEGACNALLNSKNRLLSVWGSSGYLYLIQDALSKKTFEKVHQLPKLVIGKYAEVLPGAMSNWKGLSMIGFYGSTDSEDLDFGIYAWGTKSSLYPEVLNYMFAPTIGTGTEAVFTVDQQQTTSDVDWSYTWGDNGAGNNRSQVGQFFQAGSNQEFASCHLWLARNIPAPTDGVQAELYNATLVGSTLTVGSLIATSTNTVTGTDLPLTTPSEQTFNFNYQTLTSGAYYFIAMKRTGALGADDYTGGASQTDTYTPGGYAVKTGGTQVWGTSTPGTVDLAFKTYYYAGTVTIGAGAPSTKKIGAIRGIGNDLYYSWQSGTSPAYGVDKVTNSADSSSAYIETLINDDNNPGNDKLAMVIKATHSALTLGQTIQLGYKKNRAVEFTLGNTNSTIGTTETRLVIPPADARYREIEAKCILTATSGLELYSIGLKRDDLSKELDY